MNYKLALFCILSLFFFSFASASVTLSNGSILNATTINASISFTTYTLYADDVLVNGNAIYIENASFTSTINGVYPINITKINQTTPNVNIEPSAFLYIDSDTETSKRLKSNISGYSNLTISNISVRSCSAITSISFRSVSNASQKAYAVSEYNCSNNFVNDLSITNLENTSNDYNELSITYYSGASTGGGGGLQGGSNSGNVTVDKYLCEKTFDYINKYGENNYADMDVVVEEIKKEKGYIESKTKIQDYIMNWQYFCSDKIGRTLEEENVCSRVYYFLINTEGNYTGADILNLKMTVSRDVIDISSSLLSDYTQNYTEKCLDITGKKLPFEKKAFTFSPIDLPVFKIINDLPECNPSFNNKFFDFYIPFINWNMKQMDCADIDFWRWVLKLESATDSSYTVRGIKILNIIGILGLLFLFIVTIKIALNLLGIVKSKRIKNESN